MKNPRSSAQSLRGPDRRNSFDLLRLIAAVMVLVSHSFPLVGHPEPELAGVSLGGFGVIVFFAISGYLVTRSWSFDARLKPFAAKRALRLFPALAATVLVTAYAIGPVVTTLPLGAYFSSTEPLRHVIDNLRMSSHYLLPGVFETTPFDGVNGSLWTLPIALNLIAVFCVSALLYVHREQVPFRGDLALGALGVWLISLVAGLEPVASVLVLPYVILYLGFLEPGHLKALTRPGDVSYGLYLWAFPIQQCVVTVVGPKLSPLGMMVLALPLTYVVALVSWRIIEAPALRLKRRLGAPRRPALPAATAPARA